MPTPETPATTAPAKRPATLLPDFCSLSVLFALLLLAVVMALVMALASGGAWSAGDLSTAVLFAAWLALIVAVCLCRLQDWLAKLAPLQAYAGIWLLMVAVVLAASVVVVWLDHRLGTGLTPQAGRRFVVANSLVVALVGALLLRYFHVLAQWQDRTRAAARARSEALQARIRPHFLFNSMNTVAALVRLDPAAAERTIENLSELFRAALGTDGSTGSLAEELELVDRYLAIEQLRLGERLAVERDLDAAPAGLVLPRLLLQPLVENAVYHGVQTRRDGGTVRLAAHRDDESLELVIDNPLPDVDPGGGHGHAQDNVRHRIAYHFGNRGGFEAGVVGDRYQVRIRLPLDHETTAWTS